MTPFRFATHLCTVIRDFVWPYIFCSDQYSLQKECVSSPYLRGVSAPSDCHGMSSTEVQPHLPAILILVTLWFLHASWHHQTAPYTNFLPWSSICFHPATHNLMDWASMPAIHWKPCLGVLCVLSRIWDCCIIFAIRDAWNQAIGNTLSLLHFGDHLRNPKNADVISRYLLQTCRSAVVGRIKDTIRGASYTLRHMRNCRY